MFSHVMLGSNDVEKSKKFYDAILGALGYEQGVITPNGACMYSTPTGSLGLLNPINGEKATHGNGMTIGFSATSSEAVDAWHKAGVENGGTTCENPPGLRDLGAMKIYLAYLRDPDGNKLCAGYFM